MAPEISFSPAKIKKRKQKEGSYFLVENEETQGKQTDKEQTSDQ
jgi:hypothetical protein